MSIVDEVLVKAMGVKLVQVRFAGGGKTYTYKTDMNLKVGSTVIVPVGGYNDPYSVSYKDGIVAEVNIPTSALKEGILYRWILGDVTAMNKATKRNEKKERRLRKKLVNHLADYLSGK